MSHGNSCNWLKIQSGHCQPKQSAAEILCPLPREFFKNKGATLQVFLISVHKWRYLIKNLFPDKLHFGWDFDTGKALSSLCMHFLLKLPVFMEKGIFGYHFWKDLILETSVFPSVLKPFQIGTFHNRKNMFLKGKGFLFATANSKVGGMCFRYTIISLWGASPFLLMLVFCWSSSQSTEALYDDRIHEVVLCSCKWIVRYFVTLKYSLLTWNLFSCSITLPESDEKWSSKEIHLVLVRSLH